jgi:hypothetical protein
MIFRCSFPRSHLSFIFTCDSETNKDHWSALPSPRTALTSSVLRFSQISNSIFGYYRYSPVARKLGWFYEVCLGSLHSAAYTGAPHPLLLIFLISLSLGNSLILRKHLRTLEKHKIRFNADVPDECGKAHLSLSPVARSNSPCR